MYLLGERSQDCYRLDERLDMGQKYTNISDLYKQVKLNDQDIKERKLTPQELEDREKIAKKLPMADFKRGMVKIQWQLRWRLQLI